jgi:hypothetical protein
MIKDYARPVRYTMTNEYNTTIIMLRDMPYAGGGPAATKSNGCSPQCRAISALATSRSLVISRQSLPWGGIGTPITTVIDPRLGSQLSGQRICRVPRIAMGQTGLEVSTATLKALLDMP